MFRFCRSKCNRAFKAKRNPRKVRWTKAFRKTHGKELIVDKVLSFEKGKDTAVRYNRDLWVQTVQAMEKIDKIKSDREVRYMENRLKKSEKMKNQIIVNELIKNQTLIPEPEIREKVEELKEKKLKRREQRIQKRINERLNRGLNEDVVMEIDGKGKKDKHTKQTKSKKKKMAVIKRKYVNRHYKEEVTNEEQ